MRAVVMREYGDAGVLRLEDCPDPAARDGHVVVELRAAALNHRDLFLRQGRYDLPLPLTPGSDGAGVRRDTGEAVVILPSVAWGDGESAPGPAFRVLGGADPGTHAELIAVPEENLFPKPAHLDWHAAAALPLAGLTAHRALFARGRLRAGETLLVLGAGGGVATMAVMLGAAAGARVLVTSSSPDKLARAYELGASDGVLYTEPGWEREIRARSGGGGADLAIDSGGATIGSSLECVARGGRVVTLGATVDGRATLDVRRFFGGQYDLLGTTMGSPRDFAALLEIVTARGLRPAVDRVFPLDEIAAAHAHLEAQAQTGKVVLDPA